MNVYVMQRLPFSICSGADFVAEKSSAANRLRDSLQIMMLRGHNRWLQTADLVDDYGAPRPPCATTATSMTVVNIRLSRRFAGHVEVTLRVMKTMLGLSHITNFATLESGQPTLKIGSLCLSRLRCLPREGTSRAIIVRHAFGSDKVRHLPDPIDPILPLGDMQECQVARDGPCAG